MPNFGFTPLSKDQAVELLRQAAWTETIAACGHTGCTDHPGPGRTRIHSFLGGLGADHDVDDAENIIRAADKVGWLPNVFSHDLHVRTSDGRTYHYDVPKPSEADHGT